MLALSAVSLLTDLSSEIIYPLLPLFLSTVLGASAATLGAIEGAAESTAALLKLASGWWSDRMARRKPLVVAGYLLASVARPLVGLATSAGQVLAIRLTDRVGKGIRGAPRDALIADSVTPLLRGRAFGLHRAADHLGAVGGPLLAFLMLEGLGMPLRTVFLWAAVPGALAVAMAIWGVRETPRELPGRAAAGAPASAGSAAGRLGGAADGSHPASLGGSFWRYLGVLVLFTLGNATDAFILLRATQLGVAVALVPLLWAMLHVVKSASSVPGGLLSDRVGRKVPIVAGWALYALVYLLFGRATEPWHAWALFAVYGLYSGLTEGVEKALVADLSPIARRGAAFGWYNLAIGVGALPASVIFGLLWDHAGPSAAFDFGALLAGLAAVGLLVFVPGSRPAAGGRTP
ncbi:MAG: MFS transporter [Gemmatimonadaceae bacterium]